MRKALLVLLVVVPGCSRPSHDDSIPGGTGTPPVLIDPLNVLSTNPTNLQEDVSGSQVVGVTFSKQIATFTLLPSTFFFSSPYGPMDGALTGFGNIVTFTPAAPLPPSVPIVGTVTPGLKGMGGEKLVGNFTWTFRTGIRPQPIATDAGINQVRLAASAGGLVMVLYAQSTSGPDRLFARHYLPDTGWNSTYEIPVTINPVNYLKLQCTSNNEAVAMWTEGGPAWPVNVRTARFTLADGWGSVETLATNATSPIAFRLNESGLGIASWSSSPGTSMRYRNPDGTWQAEIQGSFSDGCALGANGEISAGAWAMFPATGSGPFFGLRYVPGGAWTSTQLVNGGAYTDSVTASTGTDNAVLAVLSNVGFRSWLFDGAAWNELPTIAGAPFSWNTPQFKLTPAGNGCVAWRQWTGSSWSVMAVGRNAATGWDSIVGLETSDAGVGWISMAVTSDETAWVVWSQSDGVADSIWRATYTPGAGWALTLLDEDEYTSWDAQVSAMGDVRAAAWLRSRDQTTDLMATILD